ncbi:MAG: MFS transporter [Coriobacteriales bacterium]|jgi:MFS family permease|nr:MFS transporter [Coriobacteriales bacterium]
MAEAKSSSFQWVVLAVTYLFSVAAAMFWFTSTSVADGFIMQYIIPNPDLVSNPNMNLGLLMTDVCITAFVGALFCFLFQDRIGIKITMVIGALFLIGGGLIAALSGSDWNLLVASRFVGGFGIGCAATAATTAISVWFSEKRRGLAIGIWGTWVPVAMIINYVIIRPFALNGMIVHDDESGLFINTSIGAPDFAATSTAAPNIHILFWVGLVVSIIAFILLLVIYKDPAKGSGSVHVEKGSFGAALKWIGKRRVIALLLCMLLFTFCNNNFTSFNVAFFTAPEIAGGLGFDQTTAGLVAVVASACGIIAPLFGVVYDKITPNRKYIMIVVAAVSYIFANICGFKDWGIPYLVAYIVFMVIGNASIVASVRPMLPSLVHKGGFSAISLGLAAITFLEFVGQLFGPIFGAVADSSGFGAASLIVGLPVAVVFVFVAFLVRPGKADRLPEGTKPE